MSYLKYSLFSLLLFPGIVFAYLPTYAGYDIKKCLYLQFEPKPKPYAGAPLLNIDIQGYTQKVEGKGNSVNFKGSYNEKGKLWSFSGDSNFPLHNSSFKEIDIGIKKCVIGCSNHGVEFLLETSMEGPDWPVWKFLKKYELKVKKICPTLNP